ncbi:MAG: phosphatidylinositol mannoside acyltransferase [Actinobacteria bacterium]|nr:phosphatidylinositol mannoside acyltransferase [Actinomycetota bacterium]
MALRLIRGGSAFCQWLPAAAVPTVERVAGQLTARTMRGRRAQVERNIERIYGSHLAPSVVDGIVAETFTSYARYWIESFRLPGKTADELDAGVTIDGFRHIADAIEAGTGLIIALPHLGGWEWAAFWLAEVHGFGVTAVAEALEPPEVADWFVSLRTALGMEIHPLGPGAGTACVRALRENRIVCLVCDRDLLGDGVPVQFFGEETTLPAGPATLALRTGAPVVTVATYFEGRRHHLVVDEPVDVMRRGRLRDDVARITADIGDRLETLIRAAPEQWHLLQPNWPSDRVDDGRRSG